MGFWDWLVGKPRHVSVAADRIWKSQPAKFQGLRRAVQEQRDDSDLVLVLAHFPQTLAQVQEALAEIPLRRLGGSSKLSTADVVRQARKGADPCLALTGWLAGDSAPRQVDEEAGPVSILVAERHFLRSQDERIGEFAQGLGRRCRIQFFLSLHDPLLRTFVGPWVENLLTQLGLAADEPLESHLVARRVRKAQAAVAQQARDERPANSAQEWLQANGLDTTS
jgi:preprotein translocase subunit SecA